MTTMDKLIDSIANICINLGLRGEYSPEEIADLVCDIEFVHLYYALRDLAEPVYAFSTDGERPMTLKYRSRKLFDRNATLLWREPVLCADDTELASSRYLELWLLEDMSVAVVSCVQIVYAASTSGNSVDRGVTLDGSGSTTGSNVWYALPAARREAIGLILLYSNQMWNHSISVTTTSKANNPNVPLRIATQFLIYEIVCGLRNPSTFTLNSTNECGTAGDIFYNAGVASVTNFTSNYNTLVSNIQAAKKIPSFTAASSGSAPTINLTGEETSVYDSNGVLSNFSFTDGNGAEFYKSGSTLYITQTGTISSSTVFKATRYLPSAANSTYNVWYMSGSSYQTTVSLASASSGSLNAYFKLKAPDPGTISLTKTTEDGQILSSWRFGVYTNSACTSLAAGPYSTNTSGKISVTGLTPGTYYVKELGHTDTTSAPRFPAATPAPVIWCSSRAPTKPTVFPMWAFMWAKTE